MSKKPQAFLTIRPSFEENLQAFLEYKIPCELFVLWFSLKQDHEFNSWLGTAVRGVRGCLQDLYEDCGILPAPVLLILSKTKHLCMTRSRPVDRGSRQRLQDIKALNAALKVIETYDSPSLFFAEMLSEEEMEQERTAKNYLRSLSRAIDMIKPRKEPDVEMRFCAQSLEDFFRSVTGKPMHETIGFLLVHALDWPRPRSDLRLAAIQRAKGPAIVARRLMLEAALDLQNGDTNFWFEQEKDFARDRDEAKKLRDRLIHRERAQNSPGATVLDRRHLKAR